MCDLVVEEEPGLFWIVPDQYKTQKMCDLAVEEDLGLIEYVLDWFVRQQQIDIWHQHDGDDDNDNGLIEWYEGYEKRKVQKAKIKEELIPIVWNPDRVMDWCMSEDEKRRWK